MYSLPIQNNTYINIGPDDKTKNIANFQPVPPFDLNDDWTVVARTIIPVVSSPVETYSGGKEPHKNNSTNGKADNRFFY